MVKGSFLAVSLWWCGGGLGLEYGIGIDGMMSASCYWREWVVAGLRAGGRKMGFYFVRDLRGYDS